MIRSSWFVLLGLGLVACEAQQGIEGVDPGSCEDEIDNDADGYVDCGDPGCFSNAACLDEDTDTNDDTDDTNDTNDTNDTDDGGGGGGGTDLSAYTAMAVRYQLDVTPTGAATTLLSNFGFADQAKPCSASYFGDGTIVFAEGDIVQYEGSWNEVEDTCAGFPPNEQFPQFEGLTLASTSVWYVDSGEAFHTFKFPSSRARITSWVVHRFEDDSALTTQPFENSQYWIRFTEPHTFDTDTLNMTYVEEQLISIEGLLPIRFKSTYEVQFTKEATPPDLDPYDVTP